MRNVRGLIALTFSILLAFIAAMAAYRHMNRPPPAIPTVAAAEPVKTAPPAKRFSQRIETGMRAVTLVVDDMTDTVGELAPGDQVDVLAVTPIPGETDGRVSRLLLSGARIMDVESHAKSRGGHAHAFKVTLTVTPGEAAAIASADPSAAIRLIARNPGDDLRETQPPTAFAADRGIQVYASQQRDMTRLIAPGMRAITLEVKPTDGVGGVFRPGDHVDILVTCPYGNSSLQGKHQSGETAVITDTFRNSRVMLQNIRVIATNQSLTWQSDLNQCIQRVTLEVSPADAEKLTVLADSKKSKSTLRLISRNHRDRDIAQTQGVELLDLLVGRKPYMTVEVITGSKKVDQIFYH